VGLPGNCLLVNHRCVQNNETVEELMENKFKLKVLFVEDDQFTQRTVAELLNHHGVEVLAVKSVSEAIICFPEFDPHAVLTDLDLGAEPNGGDLLRYLNKHYPWIGKVILTAHPSPEIALGGKHNLPDDVTFLIKSLVDGQAMYDAILNSIEATQKPQNMSLEANDASMFVSKSQGELLRMLAEGLSNSAIAQKSAMTLPATKSVIHRLFVALGLDSDANTNQRVMAVKMWQQGKVRIK
jgi:DNA-binding NarL/FixJ family response regulator